MSSRTLIEVFGHIIVFSFTRDVSKFNGSVQYLVSSLVLLYTCGSS